MLSDNLNVILAGTKFPENIGMAARACANMGCRNLRLARPVWWEKDKAIPLATPKGSVLLDNIRIFPDLAAALADSTIAYATTARIGGWRKTVISPWQAAKEICGELARGEKISLVFGPEDKGLGNEEIILCGKLIHIKTYGPVSSLNLAQAVLIVLYECAKEAEYGPIIPPKCKTRRIALDDFQRLEMELKNVLASLDCAHGQNPDYYFIKWRDILTKASLKRDEYDALMGFCRQIKNKLQT